MNHHDAPGAIPDQAARASSANALVEGPPHDGRRSWVRVSTLCCALILLSGHPLQAQRAKLRIESEEGYVNQPLRIQVDVTGLDDKSQPQVELVEAIAPALTLTRTGVAPQISSSVTIINGRMNRESSTRWLFTFEVLASEVGTYPIGPFKITQDDKELTTAATEIEFGEIELDENMRVEFAVADRDYFVGERAPVRIRWSYTGELGRLGNVAVRAPMLDRFEMTPVLNQNQTEALPVLTSRGSLRVPVTVEMRDTLDQETVRFEGEGEVLLNQVGEFEFAPVSATAQYVTRWSRDPRGEIFPGFGSMGPRRAATAKPIRAVGSPLSIRVLPLPTAGRPASFAGTVGGQYGIQVEANRTVVRVDDPIGLTVTLLGDQSLETAGLPDLSADGGMSPQLFRLPEESPSGVFRDGRRQFEITVRVKEEAVTEIPSLAYSWFDPVAEQYKTAHSDPIALRVLPAQVVSAADVVSAAPPAAPADHDSHPAPPDRPQDGLDLSIEQEVTQLTQPSRRAHPIGVTLPYAAGMAVLLWAFVDRRRLALHAAGHHTRREMHAQVRNISAAHGLPQPEAAQQVAAALRALLPEADAPQREAADEIIGQLEAVLFSPSGAAGKKLDETLVASATRVANKIIETSEAG